MSAVVEGKAFRVNPLLRQPMRGGITRLTMSSSNHIRVVKLTPPTGREHSHNEHENLHSLFSYGQKPNHLVFPVDLHSFQIYFLGAVNVGLMVELFVVRNFEAPAIFTRKNEENFSHFSV